MNNLTKDQLAAIMRHSGNSAASFVAGACIAALVLSLLDQGQVDRLLQSFGQFADGFGKLVPILLLVVPLLVARSASNSASPAEQVRKVEENVPGVVVQPTTLEGAQLVKDATGILKQTVQQ